MPTTTPRKSKALIPTIDCALITIQIENDEFGFDTSNRIAVEAQTEEQAAVRLIVKGILRAQKKRHLTIVGHQITLTDNVFNPDLVIALQGGSATYDTTGKKLTGYTPPVTGAADTTVPFTLNAYSAQYDAAGQIVQYEKISYPNCQGQPVAFASEDGVFRAPEYTIVSAPKQNEYPYQIAYVAELPELESPWPTPDPED